MKKNSGYWISGAIGLTLSLGGVIFFGWILGLVIKSFIAGLFLVSLFFFALVSAYWYHFTHPLYIKIKQEADKIRQRASV